MLCTGWLPLLLLCSALMLAPGKAEESIVTPGKEQTLSLNASANHSQRGFKKFLYGWSIPENALFTGLTGSISTSALNDGFNEALISVRWIPSGACPQYAEVYNTIEQVNARYPNTQRLVQYILKKPTAGASTLPVKFKLPIGIPISHCVYVIFEGSTLTGGSYTMTSNLVLHYTTGTPPSQPLSNEIFGDEFCWGMEKGCQNWHTRDNTKSFASFTPPVRVDTQLVVLHGDLSSSAMAPTALPAAKPRVGTEWRVIGGDPPRGAWSVTNDVYILNDCTKIPRGPEGPGDFYDDLPSGAVNIFSLTMEGYGMQSLQQPVHKDFANVVIPKGGCMAHLVKRTGNGSINSEFQLMAFTRAAR